MNDRIDPYGAEESVGEDAFFEELKEKDSENRLCFECGGKPTTWASVSFGIFLCLKCAGVHRSYGTEVSFIRSLTLDRWKEHHKCIMEVGGNKRAKDYFSSQPIQEYGLAKYSSSYSTDYKTTLRSEVKDILGESVPEPYSPRLSQEGLRTVPSKYINATSISSDEFFNNKQNKDSCTCCTIL